MVVNPADPLDGPTRTQGRAKGLVLIHQQFKLAFASPEPGKRQANLRQFISKGFVAHPILPKHGDVPSDCAEFVKPLCNPWCRSEPVLHILFQPAKGYSHV